MFTGYISSRPDYCGTHAEPFSAIKVAKTIVGPVRRDMNGRRVIIQAAIDLPAFDQLGLGSCEAQSAVGGLMIVRPGSPMLSRRALYLESLYRDGSFPNDAGTTGETIHTCMLTTGVCVESMCPYTDVNGKWQTRPSIEALESSYDHRINATHRVMSFGVQLGADMRASIDVGRPVQDGGPCSDAYRAYFSGLHDAPMAFDTMLPSIGGHARLIVGYWQQPDGSFWYLERGSWGIDGGDREFPGHVWLTETCLHEYDEFFSFL